MRHEVPQSVNGWMVDTQVRQFNRKTLFKYIDGGAELYLAYRFRRVSVHIFSKPGKPDIIMDLYDMTTPQDAFGVFTAEREGDDIGIGNAAEYEGGLLRFCKGRFFVSIMTHEETPESKRAVLSLAKTVAVGIEPIGEKPELLSALPETGRIDRSIRYFHDHNILNLHYYIADENILRLDMRTEAVLARYAADGGKPYLLVIRYPSTARATSAFRSFLETYMPEAMEAGLVQTEDGRWTGAFSHSEFVWVVFEGPSKHWTGSLLETVRTQLEVKP